MSIPWGVLIAVGLVVAFLALGFHWIIARERRRAGQDDSNARTLSLRRRQPGPYRDDDDDISRDPHGRTGSGDTAATLALRRDPQPARDGTNFPLRPGHLIRPVARRGPLTVALYFWPTLSSEHLVTARRELDRVCVAIRDRLGIRLNLLPPAKGRLVQGDPARLGLVACASCGAYAHGATDITIVFKALRDAAGQPVADCGGVTAINRNSTGAAARFANVDVSFVLAGATANPDEKLYHVLLHTVLNALARQPTKHTNPWGGVFLVPSPNCDREYNYRSAYGESPEERARAGAEGWKHYNEAILSGTAIRYVPFLDGPRDAAHP